MIEVRSITKRYGTVEAVRDLSFSLGKEQVLGFLGPNGAGKTTVMKILTGYHFPTEGEALLDGFSVQEDPEAVKRRIGYLPESVPLYGDLTAAEYLGFIAASRLIAKEKRRDAVFASMETCGLLPMASRAIETLSKGYKQRLGLAQAIIHDPPILILDEPTTGLDPNQIIEIRSLIKGLGKRKTVILSTHILQEVEAVCSQVLIINEGRLAAQGRVEEIAATMRGGDTWELVLKGAPLREVEADLEGLALSLGNLSGASAEAAEGGVVKASFVLGGDLSPALQGERIFDWAVSGGLKILSMNRKKLSLEDIFVKLTGEPLTSEPLPGEPAGEAAP